MSGYSQTLGSLEDAGGVKVAGARLLPWAVFAYVFVATMLHGSAEFRWDALGYWNTTMDLLGADVPVLEDYFRLRGVWTAIVFAPAAFATRVLGDGVAGAAVLAQNALLIAGFAAFLAPRLVSRSGLTNPRARCLAGLLTWVALQGFAPYPLVDLYAALAVLAALPLLVGRDLKGLVFGGVLLGFAANVRPAYMPLVAVLLVLTVVRSRRSGALAAVGTVGALLPQVVFNYTRYAVLSVVPSATTDLVSLQTGYAAFTTRYDTVLVGSSHPRQFFCSPDMASSIGTLPGTLTELAGTFLAHLPVSLPFVLQKVAASLLWPMSIPYFVASPGFNAIFGAAITLISVIGTAFLVFGPLLSRTVRSTLDTWPLLVAAAGVTIATVAGSAAEARFSLVLVLLGIVGVSALADASIPMLQRHWRALLMAVIVGVLVVVMGRIGLSHPAPPGDVTLEICSRA